MNPEEKELLEKTFRLSEENNKLLRKIRRATRFAFVWSVVKILIVVVPIVLGYIYFGPTIEEMFRSFNEMVEMFNV